MTAVEKLRALVDERRERHEINFDVISGFNLIDNITLGDFVELLQEIDRLRADAADTREACARICDERAGDAHNPLADLECDADVIREVRRSMVRRREAESCAAAIRAGGQS